MRDVTPKPKAVSKFETNTYFGKLENKKVVTCDSPADWGNVDDRTVGVTDIGKIRVSTVFLGLNHGHDRPLWFETMVFGGRLDGAQSRYETWEEAEAGHKSWVRIVERDGSFVGLVVRIAAYILAFVKIVQRKFFK